MDKQVILADTAALVGADLNLAYKAVRSDKVRKQYQILLKYILSVFLLNLENCNSVLESCWSGGQIQEEGRHRQNDKKYFETQNSNPDWQKYQDPGG